MPGVWTWNFGEAFGHHYLDSVAMNHNSLGRGYETWGNGTAETAAPHRSAHRIDHHGVVSAACRPPARVHVVRARQRQLHARPAALAALDHVAGNAKELLRNFYAKGWNSWRKGLDEAPYAFVIPEDQGDRRASRRWSRASSASASR